MKISRDSWHVKVYLQAYANDRTWIDPDHSGVFWDESQGIDLPEREAFWKFQESNPNSSWRDGESGEEFRDLLRSWNKARKAWCDAKFASYSTEKSSQVRSRLLLGKTSLCPYFWSVVYALVVYYGLILTSRKALKALDRVFTAGERIVTATWQPVAVGALIAGTLVTGLAMQFDLLATPSDLLVRYRQEQAEKAFRVAEREKSEREWALERQVKSVPDPLEQKRQEELRKQQGEWYRFMNKLHPQFVQDEQARRAQANYEFFLMELAEEEREWNEFRQGVWSFFTRTIPVAGLTGVVVLGLFAGAGLLGSLAILLWRQVQATGLWATLKSRAQAARTFLGDTKEFVWAFLKARKEQVCPYLTVIEREHRT